MRKAPFECLVVPNITMLVEKVLQILFRDFYSKVLRLTSEGGWLYLPFLPAGNNVPVSGFVMV